MVIQMLTCLQLFWPSSHDIPCHSDSKKRRDILGEASHYYILRQMRRTRIKDQNDAEFIRKADEVRVNWGAAGRGDDNTNMRLRLNVEEGGATKKETVCRYLPTSGLSLK